MENTTLLTRYNHIKETENLPIEAQKLIEELLERENAADELISSIMSDLAEERDVSNRISEAYEKLKTSYMRLLDRS